jgi:AcrR family transcriptional regulator
MLESNVSALAIEKPPAKERILNAAERLFAEHGFEATSLRMITAEAKVNLAAVNYHFHSKDELIAAVFSRRIGPINDRRLELLAAAQDAVGGGPVPLEDVIRSFVSPVISSRTEVNGRDIGKLLGRTYSDPSESARRSFFELMRQVARPFTEAFRRALPEMPQVELLWRIHFAVGVMAHTLAGTHHLRAISTFGPLRVEAVTDCIVAFVAAGIFIHAGEDRSRGKHADSPPVLFCSRWFSGRRNCPRMVEQASDCVAPTAFARVRWLRSGPPSPTALGTPAALPTWASV